MKTERWRQIEQLYHAAREREPRERDRFLQEACADEEVRGEVESLLGCEAQADGFLEAPAIEVTAEALAEGRARSMFGRALGHYQIVAFLGAGGMGEVYGRGTPGLDATWRSRFCRPASPRIPSGCGCSSRRPGPLAL